MSDLPAGTVTFLFTDIEGSTRLLEELGDAYAGALAEHRRTVRAAFADWSGAEVDTQGDAFFYAFARASDAVAAAEQAQRALAGGPVRVRMGIHTGEPLLTDEGYVGMDVHTAARIAACAHGGQVVVSRRTRELAGNRCTLIDVGDHRVKDLSEPLRLYQVGEAEFPPLRSVSATNLPEPLSSFIGRRAQLASAAALLAESRILTVTGPGGCGKTRFAIALARGTLDDQPDGAWWVPLAGLRDARLVLPTIEQAVGAQGGGLAKQVGERRMLVLLDNFEHVISAAPEVSAFVAACPNVTVLVTSRELLRVEGERAYYLDPLSDDEGAALFCERAYVLETEDARELCRRLEGLPLAIELAAARASLLDPGQILERLGQRLDLFRGGRDADPRHATLRATIEWSFDLLAPSEQRAFARFAVFSGGATVDAAEAVTEADAETIQSLLDKSLLRRSDRRLWMFETVRDYALERLRECGDAVLVEERHAGYYLGVARATHLSGTSAGEAHHDIALAEQSNFRAALTWAARGGDVELGLRLATALENFWVSTDPFEAMRWFDALLAQAGDVHPQVRGNAYRAYGGVVNPTGDDDLAEELYQCSLAEFRRAGDEDGAAGALIRLGYSAWYRGDPDTAMSLGREGLAGSRGVANQRAQALALGLIGELEWEARNHDRGLQLMEESAATAAACGFVWWQARMMLRLAKRAREAGRAADASRWAGEGLRLAARISDRRRVVQLIDVLAAVAADLDDGERAGVLSGAVAAEVERAELSAWSPTALPAAIRNREVDEAVERGRRLSLEEAVDRALS